MITVFFAAKGVTSGTDAAIDVVGLASGWAGDCHGRFRDSSDMGVALTVGVGRCGGCLVELRYIGTGTHAARANGDVCGEVVAVG